MATTNPLTPPPPTSLLLKIHQQKALDQKKAYDQSKKQDLVYSLMAESLKQNVALKKPRVAKKLKFDEADMPPPPVPPSSPALTRTSMEEEEDKEIICFCNDPAKVCTARAGKIFYCCPHSRYVIANKKYESDCDFFLFKENISSNKCHCGYGMRQFLSKDKEYLNESCIYKNAPTVWKKMNHYCCDMMTRTKIEDKVSELC